MAHNLRYEVPTDRLDDEKYWMQYYAKMSENDEIVDAVLKHKISAITTILNHNGTVIFSKINGTDPYRQKKINGETRSFSFLEEYEYINTVGTKLYVNLKSEITLEQAKNDCMQKPLKKHLPSRCLKITD